MERNLRENPFMKAIFSAFSTFITTNCKDIDIYVVVPSVDYSQGAFYHDCLRNHVLIPGHKRGTLKTLSGRVVQINDGRITSKLGFSMEMTLEIRSKETVYDGDGNQVTAYRVNNFLDEKLYKFFEQNTLKIHSLVTRQTSSDGYVNLFESKIYGASLDTFNQMKEVMNFFKENNSFVGSYVAESGSAYIKMCDRLKKMYINLLNQIGDQYEQVEEYQDIIHEFIESITMDNLDTKLTNFVDNSTRSQDIKLNEKLTTLPTSVLAEKILPANFCDCSFRTATKEVEDIDDCSTPWEKLVKLRTVGQKIQDDCQNHLKTKQNPKWREFNISADEFIPMLAFVLSQSNVPNLLAMQNLLNYFTYARVHVNSLGFVLMQYGAALADLENTLKNFSEQSSKTTLDRSSFSELKRPKGYIMSSRPEHNVRSVESDLSNAFTEKAKIDSHKPVLSSGGNKPSFSSTSMNRAPVHMEKSINLTNARQENVKKISLNDDEDSESDDDDFGAFAVGPQF
mmetsp:Transcript_16056/g.17967  ORF Transcript_16056/g.17967 Transcript_16056/m.17967 type:complete len:510 (-) Transcript_16056:2387-3916(-)